FGLLLSKNGTTPTNAAAGARIAGARGLSLSALGFDVRNGGHCGAGAPRFNAVTMDGVAHFFGRVYGSHSAGTPAPGWTRVRFGLGDAFPPVPAGSTLRSIGVVFDEGTDTGADFSGVAILDNLLINDTLITRGGWTAPPRAEDGSDEPGDEPGTGDPL